MKRKIYITLIISLIITNLSAQDYFFTQNTTSQYLSPSFAGIDRFNRLSFGFKTNLDVNLYNTTYVSYDQFFDKIKSGIGINIMTDRNSMIGITELSLNYNYELNINDKIKFRPALGISYRNDFVNFNQLTFGDQISSTGYISPATIASPTQSNKSVFDFATSLLVYANRFWCGFTVNHLAPVNVSMYHFDIPLEPKFSVFGGYKQMISENSENSSEKSIILTANYVTNTIFDYSDFRAYVNWDIITFALGMRNSLINKYNMNSATLISILGIKISKFNIGYSYDWGLNSILSYHEISLTYLFEKHEKVSKKVSK